MVKTETTEPSVKIGQIWREVDPRFTRHVKVIFVAMGRAQLRLVSNSSGAWIDGKECPRTANVDRFKGKRGGYTYVSE